MQRTTPVQAVLWDVGGPINTEVQHEAHIDADIREAFRLQGMRISNADYARAWELAVGSYAPDAYRAVIWMLSDRNHNLARQVHARMTAQAHGRNAFELREGIAELLAKLDAQHIALGLVANQPAATIRILSDYGIDGYFTHNALSGTLGFRKPDVRLFLAACDGLDVQPQACVMVGDRIDNDIAPAKTLGMQTVLYRTGRHVHQQPRSWDEVPDAEVTTVAELTAALDRLIAAS